MTFLELLIIAIGLSMDAFAVAICTGLTMKKATVRKSLVVGAYFGVFQAVMPVIGFFFATLFAEKIIAYDHWVAFVLLSFLGGRMIWGVFQKEENEQNESAAEPRRAETSLTLAAMLPLSLATSIDALAVGVSFAFLQVAIVSAASFVGMTTFAFSVLGVQIGNAFGAKFKSKAEWTGGVILIMIGLKILLEHLGVLGFWMRIV